jgi:hypothetical protein
VRPDFEKLALREPIAGRDTSIFPGDIEISIPLRDQIVAWVHYLERHIDPKRLKPAHLSPLQQQVVALEAQAWARAFANQLTPSGYVRWKALKPHIPCNFYAGNSENDSEDAFKRNLTNWRRMPAYRAEFVILCSAELTAAGRRRQQKNDETK